MQNFTLTTGFNPLKTAFNLANFLGTNGGFAKFGLQLLPNAITSVNGKPQLFNGMGLFKAMQPANKTIVCPKTNTPYPNNYGHRAQILWACVNGLPTQYVGKGAKQMPKNGIAPITIIPTNTNKVVPLSHIQLMHAVSGSSILANQTSTQATNQNAVASILNGAVSFTKNSNSSLGTCFAKIVPLATK